MLTTFRGHRSPPSRVSTHVRPVGALAIARHYLRDIVYGANDGIITTFAVVAGVTGGALSERVVLIIGVANLLADGLSMAVGNFLSIRSHEGTRRAQNLPEEESEPARHGAVTFAAFVAAGSLPLLPYAVPASVSARFGLAILLTFAALAVVGILRSTVTDETWWESAVEMLGLGGVVAGVAYASGLVISRISAASF